MSLAVGERPILLSTAAIGVGDIWQGHQRAHKGWRVQVTKIAPHSVEFELLKSQGASRGQGRPRHMPQEVFLRDFIQVHKTERLEMAAPTQSIGIPAREGEEPFVTCKKCGVLKPIEDYQLVPKHEGSNFTASRQRLFTCHPCMKEARAAGIRRSKAAKKLAAAAAPPEPTTNDLDLPLERKEPVAPQISAQVKDFIGIRDTYLDQDGHLLFIRPQTELVPKPEPKPEPPVPVPVVSIHAALLDLAARAEALERPPAYRQLCAAVEEASRVGTDAGAVFVIPADTWLAIMEAHEAAAADLERGDG